MRTFLRLLAALSGGAAASALTLDIPRLPAPAFADREVCGDTVLPASAAENPLLLRGQPISSTGADGVATSYAYVPGTYDPATRTFTAGGAATHLRTTTTSTAAASDGIPGQSTVSVMEEVSLAELPHDDDYAPCDNRLIIVLT